MADARSVDAAANRSALPPRSILSQEFRYIDAAHTDVAATFRRIRREMKLKPTPKPDAVELSELFRRKTGT